MKLLILEDSKSINNQLKMHILKQITIDDIEIFQAFSLKEAFEQLENNKFDLIISDLNLPDGEADELVSKFGKTEKIIILTSDSDFQRRSYLFSQGIIDYYSKNMPIEYVVSKIIDKYNQIIENRNSTILNIDDSSFSRNLIQKVLENNGFNVISKNSAKTILEDIKKDIDLIIIDLEMPDINGLEAIRMIRKVNKEIPIIAISGSYSSQNEIIKILKNGANDFITKPFYIENLILKVEQISKINKLNNFLKNKNTQLKEAINIKNYQIKEKEEEILKNSKKAAIGEMIDYIIHQWRQPLNIIKLELINFELTHQNIPNIETFTEKINGKVSELDEIISDFRNFFKEQEPELLNLESEVLKSLKIIKSLLIKNSAITEIDADNSQIMFTKNDFKHIMLVLVNNSIDAFKQNKIDINNRKINISIKDKTMTFSDNAGGIKPENREKLFQYNFTTKESGTGIGLYMIKNILEKQSASISYKPIENGSSFIIKFN